ncbi:uncharacterized protein P884DRAFT_259584 [Thermothelomyces heterothallicus CBS 202.75]|uniref:uncharacterized protein n=1 Tax=Thermothelomyces heterothallicus CBS 202.75 TaxID=1149848 RepID=UPI0037424702
MSSNEKKSGEQQYFPPPPPGPPPVQATQTSPLKHPDETPLPDYPVPEFAPPPAAAEEDIYNASPVDEHPTRWGHDHGHHAEEGEGEAKKKSNRLSAFGHAITSKVAGPVNALANKFGSEGFMPESLDKECEKAARILRSFCKEGIYTDDSVPPAATTPAETAGPQQTSSKPPASPSSKAKKSHALLTIPSKVIARAQGLAIFTAVRLGFQATGSSGSGILIARLDDGSWSPPSGIQITSIGAGFVAGVDIYDCVLVINTREALDMFIKIRVSLGSDLAVTAGPFGAGGALDWGLPAGGDRQRGKEAKGSANPSSGAATLAPSPLSADNTHFQTPPVTEDLDEDDYDDGGKGKHPARRPSPFRDALKKPVYSYIKSRGFYAGVQIDGTIIAPRDRANAEVYGKGVSVGRILRGEVPARSLANLAHQQHGGAQSTRPGGAKILYDVLRGAEQGWKGHGQQQQQQEAAGQQAPPYSAQSGTVSPGYGGPSPAFGAPPGTGGAPTSAWVPPPPPPGPPPAAASGSTAAQGVYGVTAGMKDLGIGSSSGVAPPPDVGTSSAAAAKAAEAAAEAARAQQEEEAYPPPPSYSEPPAEDDLPPAYEEDERYKHFASDSKTGLH